MRLALPELSLVGDLRARIVSGISKGQPNRFEDVGDSVIQTVRRVLSLEERPHLREIDMRSTLRKVGALWGLGIVAVLASIPVSSGAGAGHGDHHIPSYCHRPGDVPDLGHQSRLRYLYRCSGGCDLDHHRDVHQHDAVEHRPERRTLSRRDGDHPLYAERRGSADLRTVP